MGAGAASGLRCGIQLRCHSACHPAPGCKAEPAARHKQICCLTCGVILLDEATVSCVRLNCCDICAGAKPGVFRGVQLGCHTVYHPTPGSNTEPAAQNNQIRLPDLWRHSP